MTENITVKELIAKLSQFDENAVVNLEGFAIGDFVEEIFLEVGDEDIFSQKFH
jgi:hypothetical protein